MRPLRHRAATAAGMLWLCIACSLAAAAPRARVVSSTWLPGGKYALVYTFEGAEYLAVSPDPPGAWVAVPQPKEAARALPPSAPPLSRAELLPNSPSYVGGFFVDPISAALQATGLGWLLGGNWPGGPGGPHGVR